ncbi:MAG: CBS domain-containing protein [Lentisphaerae bacterium]|nr:CBS domain-containing protein [Lentisphaerota bacterium]
MKTRKARDIMTTTLVTAKKDMLLTECIDLLLRWHISGMPVVDEEGRLLGLMTEHDILNFAFSGDAGDTTVEEGMNRDVVTFTPDTDVEQIVNTFAARRIRRAPIVEGGKVVGIVSRRDILREMKRVYNGY